MISAGFAAADLGERRRAARSGANLTQDAAAAALGIARTTLLAIEKGHRPVRPEELLALARLYGVSAGRLTSPDAIQMLLPFCDVSACRGKGGLQGRCRRARLAQPPRHRRRAVGAARWARAANRLPAANTRQPSARQPTGGGCCQQSAGSRLGIGLGPIPDPIGLLELELGLRIFFRPLPSQISGLYAYDPAIGACILINSNHHWKRRVQTAIHETGHFASDRSHADILEEEEISPSIDERFARRFGSAFLMPASGVHARFDQVVGSENRFNVPELILLAYQFGVATEAICRRLEELNLLPQGTWDSLSDRGFASGLERDVIGSVGVRPRPPAIPPRLAYLASLALDREVVSEGQLCDLLAVDRLELRDALAPFEAEEVMSLRADPAECGGLVLDTSVLINLLATEAVNAILEALSVPCHVPQQVLAEVCRDPVTGVIFPAERHPLREKSSGVSILALDGTELDLFLRIVGAPAGDALGVCQAAAIAVAVSRGLDLVIDDRKARRIVRERFSRVRTYWTVDLLQARPVVAALGRHQADECLAKARRFGRMEAVGAVARRRPRCFEIGRNGVVPRAVIALYDS